jgi:methionyl-tRNA formyltransferase
MALHLPDRRLRLAYFGTPELARVILAAILEADQDDVALVVCQPDKPKGRGNKVEAPPTKELALPRGIPVLQPTKMKDGVLTAAIKEAKIDLAIVAAFGRILPQDLLDAPTFGCWNVHASILPRHRGASPIQQCLLDGDEKTGVTLMQMTLGLDEGPMLLVQEIAIARDETTPSLSAKLATLGATVALRGIHAAKHEGLEVRPQDNAHASFAPIIEKSAGRIELSRPAEVLDRQIRALNPWPSTWIELSEGSEPLKVISAVPRPDISGTPGQVLDTKNTLLIATGAGALEVREVQPPGKRPMPVADYLRGAGRSLAIGTLLPHR